MSQPVLMSIVETPLHPDFAGLYRRLGMRHVRVHSMRRAIGELKKTRPDYVVAEFFYGYGNNYAGVNVSNLDVLLASLQKYAPDARVIVLVEKAEAQYVDKLAALFPLHAVRVSPVSEGDMESALRE